MANVSFHCVFGSKRHLSGNARMYVLRHTGMTVRADRLGNTVVSVIADSNGFVLTSELSLFHLHKQDVL